MGFNFTNLLCTVLAMPHPHGYVMNIHLTCIVTQSSARVVSKAIHSFKGAFVPLRSIKIAAILPLLFHQQISHAKVAVSF